MILGMIRAWKLPLFRNQQSQFAVLPKISPRSARLTSSLTFDGSLYQLTPKSAAAACSSRLCSSIVSASNVVMAAMSRSEESGGPNRAHRGASNPNAPDRHAQYALSLDTGVASAPAAPIGLSRADTRHSIPITPVSRRRTGRAAAFKPIEDYEAFEDFEGRPGWHRMLSCPV